MALGELPERERDRGGAQLRHLGARRRARRARRTRERSSRSPTPTARVAARRGRPPWAPRRGPGRRRARRRGPGSPCGPARPPRRRATAARRPPSAGADQHQQRPQPLAPGRQGRLRLGAQLGPWPTASSASRSSTSAIRAGSQAPAVVHHRGDRGRDGRAAHPDLDRAVDGDDPAGEQQPADLARTRPHPSSRRAPAGVGKLRTDSGQVAVGVGVAGDGAEHRHEPVEPERVEARQRLPAWPGDLEDHQPAARAAAPAPSPPEPALEVGEVAAPRTRP